MAGLGRWQFAAAVAKAGGHATLTASVSRTPERLREDIRRYRDATDNKTLAVNLSFTSCPRIEEMLEVCIEEGVHVETATYMPDSLAPRIREGGVKWIHKSARVKDALHAEKLGAHAVILVGLEGIGFKNPEQLPTMITTILAKRELKVPVIAAGGIGDARGFLGALGMGADGIMMGTAFMATKECPVSDAVKEAIVRARPDNPQLRHQVLATADPKAYEEVMKLRNEMPLQKWLQTLERVHLKEADWLKPDDYTMEQRERDLTKLASFAVGVIDHVSTVKELIDSIINGAEDILDSWQFLKTR
jgi:nitronate monooxygenase